MVGVMAKIPLEIFAMIYKEVANDIDGICLGLTCTAFYNAYRYHCDGSKIYGSHLVRLNHSIGLNPPLRDLIRDFFLKEWWYFKSKLTRRSMFVTTERLKVILVEQVEAKAKAERKAKEEAEIESRALTRRNRDQELQYIGQDILPSFCRESTGPFGSTLLSSDSPDLDDTLTGISSARGCTLASGIPRVFDDRSTETIASTATSGSILLPEPSSLEDRISRTISGDGPPRIPRNYSYSEFILPSKDLICRTISRYDKAIRSRVTTAGPRKSGVLPSTPWLLPLPI